MPDRDRNSEPSDLQYKWTVLTVTTVGVLMSGIDSRIVVIGLPTVAAALNADAEQAIWFTQAYTIGSTVALLFLGRVSDMYGRVRVYSIGFSVFTVGSLLTSLSPSPTFFIASRIFQGLGSAALFSNSAAIITDAFPRGELGTALGINSVAFRAGSMFGLTLSGLILAFLDWRFLFYVNIPVGIFGTLWAHVRLHEQNQPEGRSPMDWEGFFSFTCFISTLLLCLTTAAYGIGESELTVGLGAISAATLVLFVWVERRRVAPLLDLSLLRIREFTGAVSAQMINSMSWGAFLLLISLYLQLVKGFAPLQAGISIIPFDLAMLFVAPLSGKLSDRHGTRPFATAGLVVFSASLLAMSTLSPATSYTTLLAFLLVGGAGMGLFNSPNMSSAMGSVPAHRRGVASGFRATFFNIGFVLSFNIVILVLTFYLPYGLITRVISSEGAINTITADASEFAGALDNVFIVLAVINTAAIVPSLLRGTRREEELAMAEGIEREPD
ncbi:MAG TPA: MFS transporter [Nitrososphaerales archaeon]|nr:MFS transporter [Nitrososphaerales archaeon]